MDLYIALDGPRELTAQIYRRLRDAVLDGTLRAGEQLPPTRLLAQQLGVSRNTVAAAYDRLTADGFLVARVGAGTYVSSDVAVPPRRAAAADRTRARPLPIWSAVAPPELPSRPEPEFDLRVGTPDGALFPLQAWRRLVGRELRSSFTRGSGYGDPAGHPPLREAIARHVGLSRSVRADPQDVLVTQGAQQALDLIAKVLVEPGSRVAVEEPGYPPARRLLQSTGARVVGVPVDAEGLDVTAIPDAARVVYVTPSHQFPLGMPMSLARRGALLRWAERHDAVLIEDDYDCEFRFSQRALEPLQSLDRSGRVIYVGSFSKTLLPALRLGFLVAPPSLRSALRTARQLSDWHGDLVTQAALGRFIDEGLLARHIRKATREYGDRRNAVVTAVRRDLGDRFEIIGSAAGLHLCVQPAAGTAVDIDAAAGRARAAGVAVNTVAEFSTARPARAGLAIGYGSITRAGIPEGMRRLALACR